MLCCMCCLDGRVLVSCCETVLGWAGELAVVHRRTCAGDWSSQLQLADCAFTWEQGALSAVAVCRWGPGKGWVVVAKHMGGSFAEVVGCVVRVGAGRFGRVCCCRL
jgi:hypothetical protein